jgi:hypothetical protein
MLDQEGPRITLLWVLSHKGIPGNEKADQAAKKVLDEDIPTTERYPSDNMKKWLTEEDFKKGDQRWKNGNNKMKERKPDVDRKEDTKKMPRKEQVAISRSRPRTGYTRANHGLKMEGVGNPVCPFCNTDLCVEHILWEFKENEDQRTSMDMNKEQWTVPDEARWGPGASLKNKIKNNESKAAKAAQWRRRRFFFYDLLKVLTKTLKLKM